MLMIDTEIKSEILFLCRGCAFSLNSSREEFLP